MPINFTGAPYPPDPARLTADNTFTSSNNLFTNQTSVSGSSLITRNLLDSRMWQFITPSSFTTPLNTFHAATTNSGSAAINGQAARVSTSSTVVGSTALLVMLGGNGMSINNSNTGLGGSNLSFNRPWAYTFQTSRQFNPSGNTTNMYFKITKAGTGTPTYDIANTEICCGFRIYGNLSSGLMPNFQAFTCNGTTLTTTTALINSPVDDTYPVRVFCNGSGSITFAFYKIGTGWVTIGTVAQPENVGNYTFQMVVVNDGVTALRSDFGVLGNPTFMNLDTLA